MTKSITQEALESIDELTFEHMGIHTLIKLIESYYTTLKVDVPIELFSVIGLLKRESLAFGEHISKIYRALADKAMGGNQHDKQ